MGRHWGFPSYRVNYNCIIPAARADSSLQLSSFIIADGTALFFVKNVISFPPSSPAKLGKMPNRADALAFIIRINDVVF